MFCCGLDCVHLVLNSYNRGSIPLLTGVRVTRNLHNRKGVCRTIHTGSTYHLNVGKSDCFPDPKAPGDFILIEELSACFFSSLQVTAKCAFNFNGSENDQAGVKGALVRVDNECPRGEFPRLPSVSGFLCPDVLAQLGAPSQVKQAFDSYTPESNTGSNTALCQLRPRCGPLIAPVGLASSHLGFYQAGRLVLICLGGCGLASTPMGGTRERTRFKAGS